MTLQTTGQLSHQLLLLLSQLGEETDERAVVQRFREGVNALQAQFLLGEFTDSCPGPQLEVASPSTRFGAYPLSPRGGHANTEDLAGLAAAAGLVARIIESVSERHRFLEPGHCSERDLEVAIYQLKAENRNLLKLLDTVRDALYLWETDACGSLRCTQANAAAERMLGYEADELFDASPSFLVSGGTALSVADHLEELRLTGYSLFKTTHYTRDGSPVPVEVTAQLSRPERREVVATTVRDLRDRSAQRGYQSGP